MTDHPKSFFDMIEREPKVAGTRPGEADEVRYVSLLPGQTPSKEFLKVTRKIQPRLAKSGGVMHDPTNITLPDGTRFFALAFHSDVEGWQRQIEGGARELGLLSARIDSDNFVVSDSRSIPLAECKVVFE